MCRVSAMRSSRVAGEIRSLPRKTRCCRPQAWALCAQTPSRLRAPSCGGPWSAECKAPTSVPVWRSPPRDRSGRRRAGAHRARREPEGGHASRLSAISAKEAKITVDFPKCEEPVGPSSRWSIQMNPNKKYACHSLDGVGCILRESASAVISEPLPPQLLTLVLLLEQAEAEQLKPVAQPSALDEQQRA